MRPYFLGTRDQQIFCTLHLPDAGKPLRHGVLMCSPFGQEAIRTHRFFRVLADRLTRQGVAVMRFEYFVTGDSAGNDEEANLRRWSQDALLAHAELRRQTGLSDIRWLGARLGCNIALQALQQGGLQASKLILWDPVTNGPAYLEMLRSEHLQHIKDVFRRPDTPWADWQQPGDSIQEASGFPMSDAMREQIRSIHLELDPAHAYQYVVVRDPHDTVLRIWADRASVAAPVSQLDLEATFSWTEHEARDGAVVPGKALQCLLGTLGE
jgi:pimeloyl-ACP methyl ester carboxylesterase